MINLPAILLLFVSLFHTIIGLLVLAKNPRDRTNQLFGAFAASLVIWMISNYFIDHASTQSLALLLTDVTFVSSGFAILFLFVFSASFTGVLKKINKFIMALLVVPGVVVNMLSGTKLVVAGLEKQNGINGPVFGPFSVAYSLLLVIYFVLTIAILIWALRKAYGLEKVRLWYVLSSLVVAILGSLITNLVGPLLLNNVSLVVYGPFSTIFIIAGFSYSIIRHKLFDIRLVVARSVAYILLLATMASVYGATIFGASHYLFPTNTTNIAQTIVNIILAIILAFTFQPLRRFFEHITDRIFFRDRYDSQEVLNTIGKELASELLLDKLLDGVLEQLCHSLRIQHGQFFIFNKGKIYKVAHFGPLPERLIVVPELKKLRQRMMVADELDGTAAKAVMDEHGIRLSMILRTKEEFVGFLLLGDKLSGDIYSDQDLKLLDILSSELAVAIINAKAYEEIAQFNVTLQDKVNEATKRLRAANTTLRSLDKAKDEFISMASHQLRTPLTTIKGYLSMVLEGDTGKITKEQREFLNYAFGGSERMVGLISDLLNVSRLAAGRFMIDRAPTDLVAVAADEVRQLETHAQSKGLALKFEPPKGKLPLIELDENKTRQVMMNFIDNAVYYTKEGSVTVTLELDKPKGVVRFQVRDTGIGVPPDSQKKLFVKFYRASNAQNVRPDGTGLGLYLAKRVIEDQGGTILFESTEGKGSMFGFELPLVPKPLPTSKESK